jgi:hypothetical protein
MLLVQILLPVYGNDGQALLQETYGEIRDELVARFGGLTAFTESPAEGLWTKDDQQAKRDEIIMIEVMVEEVDRSWWVAYRERLEARLKQESIVIRALPIEHL